MSGASQRRKRRMREMVERYQEEKLRLLSGRDCIETATIALDAICDLMRGMGDIETSGHRLHCLLGLILDELQVGTALMEGKTET